MTAAAVTSAWATWGLIIGSVIMAGCARRCHWSSWLTNAFLFGWLWGGLFGLIDCLTDYYAFQMSSVLVHGLVLCFVACLVWVMHLCLKRWLCTLFCLSYPLWSITLTGLELVRMHSWFALPWLSPAFVWLSVPGGLTVIACLGHYGSHYFVLRLLESFARASRSTSITTCFFHCLSPLILLILLGLSHVFPCARLANLNVSPQRFRLFQVGLTAEQKFDPFKSWQLYSAAMNETKDKSNVVYLLPEGVGLFFDHALKDLKQQSVTRNAMIFGGSLVDKFGQWSDPLLFGFAQGHEFRYAKQHLVPFGEFMPWQLASLKTSPKKDLLFKVNDMVLYPLLCYDFFFPTTSQTMYSHLLIASAENTWYGNGIMQLRFIQAARFRAVESNTPLLLSMNRGYTSVISSRGEVIEQLPYAEASSLLFKPTWSMTSSWYAYLGDGGVILGVCLIEFIVFCSFVGFQGRLPSISRHLWWPSQNWSQM